MYTEREKIEHSFLQFLHITHAPTSAWHTLTLSLHIHIHPRYTLIYNMLSSLASSRTSVYSRLSRASWSAYSSAAAAVEQAPVPEVDRQLNGVTSTGVRNDWELEEVIELYNTPLMELVYKAATTHRMYFNPKEIQQCTLLSIKTGGCTEDCSYCSQSSKHKTFVKPTPTLTVEDVIENARKAKAAGSTRFCMGSAWREVGKKHAFKKVITMVKEVNSMGMEVCTTLGMLSPEQAKELKAAGVTAYNHNLDSSREFYGKIITTRSYDERLKTLENVRAAGISVCCGGIIGMGEEAKDRIGLLHTLSTLNEHPESVPVNALVAVDGTPLAHRPPVPATDMVRMIATARCLMPKSMVRLSAGRTKYSTSEQALMFMAGANSIFTGDKLLTAPNPEFDEDKLMFKELGLQGKPAHSAPLPSPYFPEEASAQA
ncbi:hypothetical protein SARC_07443 [Sphaeroforma arctica JP610]|uniref:biotin synthase n=1 Tax=Sphaeroforma arctica JP610 TaxID=667725 RepID=A0A0L0FUG0_9EUKA|nr:hypothetical protein SARC_07443 [Sphaeroforma arctica JP610]KNC80181.1 hypothetical protein SARC_07443 [Sphaeroforma arctica JP610]|eukprot:XP_014154083.1 hypothetical protein SARC_07443 [Sphaeroforma arctica JP610]